MLSGHTASDLAFTLQLPLADWNGRYAQLSCGDACGVSPDSICDNVIRRNYACLVVGPSTQLPLPEDATHALAVAAKDLIARFYGKPAATQLFLGCGADGREGLLEAQRYPQDFNAILVGAPVIEAEPFARALRWRQDSVRGHAGRPALTKDDLQRLHRAAVAKCDAGDGLVDGLIGDPLRCAFDPRTVACGKTPDLQCLSSAAVDAAARLYAGPPNPGNLPSGNAGLLPGSELQWAAFLDSKGDVARWTARKTAAPASRDASAVDLSAFAAAKGKLIIYQGLADPLVSPLRTIRYYEVLAKSMGGIVKTQGTVRLFAVPGMDHCAGGEGAHRINFLSVLENWAAGRSPDDVIAFKPLDAMPPEHPFAPEARDGAQTVVGGWMLGGPVSLEQAREQSASVLSRPVFLYPYRTQYKGRGDPKLWMNFFAPGDTAFLFN